MKTTFIYFLRDPTNPIKGYVGKTDSPKKRLIEHWASKEQCHRGNWIRSLRKQGQKPVLEIVDEVPFEHWPQLEVAYIEFFLEQGYVLVNSTKGGEGNVFTPEICARISAAKKLKNWMRGRTGESHPMFGKKHKPEALAKMSVDRKGRIPWNKGKRGLQVAWNKGKICPQISARQAGPKNHQFGKTGILSAQFGKKHLPETVEKCRAAALLQAKKQKETAA